MFDELGGDGDGKDDAEGDVTAITGERADVSLAGDPEIIEFRFG